MAPDFNIKATSALGKCWWELALANAAITREMPAMTARNVFRYNNYLYSGRVSIF